MIYIDATRAIQVRIYHNIATDERDRPTGYIDGYKPGDPIVHVATWYSTTVDNDDAVLMKAWEIFNVGDDPQFGPPNPVALEYRDRRNRSLSVGDVVQIGPAYYACQDFGWKRLTADPSTRVRDHRHGTTPVPMYTL